jgi:hypothetical protein
MSETDPLGKDPKEGGAKLDAGKPMASLLAGFGLGLMEVAKLSTFGAKKYSRGGWETVPNGIERYEDAMWRHLLKAHTEDIDPETGLSHLTAVAWNALASLEMRKRAEKKD